MGEYLPFAETVKIAGEVVGLPACRDPADRKFLELAAAARADGLVTGDSDLLALAPRSAVPILSPAQLRARLGR